MGRTMDLVYIRDLKIETIIGIYDWEREQKQLVTIDLEMATDIGPAASSEDIEQALDYKKVAKRLIAFIEPAEFLLIEAMAEQIARLVIDEFKVPWLRLRLGKPGAVTICLSRNCNLGTIDGGVKLRPVDQGSACSSLGRTPGEWRHHFAIELEIVLVSIVVEQCLA